MLPLLWGRLLIKLVSPKSHINRTFFQLAMTVSQITGHVTWPGMVLLAINNAGLLQFNVSECSAVYRTLCLESTSKPSISNDGLHVTLTTTWQMVLRWRACPCISVCVCVAGLMMETCSDQMSTWYQPIKQACGISCYIAQILIKIWLTGHASIFRTDTEGRDLLFPK